MKHREDIIALSELFGLHPFHLDDLTPGELNMYLEKVEGMREEHRRAQKAEDLRELKAMHEAKLEQMGLRG